MKITLIFNNDALKHLIFLKYSQALSARRTIKTNKKIFKKKTIYLNRNFCDFFQVKVTAGKKMPKSPFTRKPMRRTCWKWKIHGSFSQLWIRSTILCPSILGTLKAKQKPKWELSSVSLINSWYLSRSCTRRKVSYTTFDPLRFDEIFLSYNNNKKK